MQTRRIVLVAAGAIAALCVLGGATFALMFELFVSRLSEDHSRYLELRNRAEAERFLIGDAIRRFTEDVGRPPRTLEELRTPPERAKGWDGPYYDDALTDPWGGAYVYRTGSGVVASLGADGLPGGAYQDADLLQGPVDPEDAPYLDEEHGGDESFGDEYARDEDAGDEYSGSTPEQKESLWTHERPRTPSSATYPSTGRNLPRSLLPEEST